MSDNQTKLGVAPNVGGLLCYVPCCLGFFFSIVAAIVEKENKFVRFHAFQSLLFHGAALALCIVLWFVSMVAAMVLGLLALLFNLVFAVIGLALMGVSIFLMIKANNNEEFKLPVIGDMASQWV